jgi:hypothetical protein
MLQADPSLASFVKSSSLDSGQTAQYHVIVLRRRNLMRH